ncbi:glycosyl hydrolase [Paractinoplanes durhamensis]|nr:glycosyl hydrolase [Actinoplanes durhamensis]
MPTAFVLSVATTLAWAWTGGVDQIGLPLGPVGDPTVSLPVIAAPDFPIVGDPRRSEPARRATSSAAVDDPTVSSGASLAPYTPSKPGEIAPRVAADGGTVDMTASGGECVTGRKLIPSCNVLWGVAPGAHTESRGASALAAFERKTGRTQAIYHAYHGGIRQLFPTEQEIAIAHQRGRHRILFLNWKPESASWAAIAKGDRRTDAFLDRLAVHIKKTFPEQFFFAVHHEGENDVRERVGSGYTARDYAAMYRHVINRLRARGVNNIVSVLVHMAYIKHAQQSWFNSMYPGDDVVDWIGFDTYAYSDPGYGHGDFAEVFNKRIEGKRGWPGFYTWALTRHPGKPLMIAEWGVWSSKRNTRYKVDFYRDLGAEIRRFPKIRAMVQFETPHNQKGQDSSVDSTPAALQAYRNLGRLPIFQVAVTP